MGISDVRKKEIADLAEFISTDYCPQGVVSPELIAEKSGITYNYGEYGDCFNGALELESDSFHIYLNVLSTDKSRLRFSFAHELGHFFIDEHRNALKKGLSLHKSYHQYQSKNPVEIEADHFASNLLMPTSRFKSIAQSKKFDYSLIETLAKEFECSISATLHRFIEIDAYPILVVFSTNNKIDYYWISHDFPFKFFVNHRSKKLPPLTVAGDFFNHGIRCDDIEIVDACEWFSSYEDIRGVKVFERCICPTYNNTAISIIWQ
jgi:Zn-dependent peptidase ImmA (M78 family)